MNSFGDMKIVYFFLGGGGGGYSPQNWTIFRCNFYAFYGLFFTSRIFWGVAKISIIFEVLEIPDIFLG